MIETLAPDQIALPLRVCRIVTVPITFSTLLFRQIKAIADSGIELTLVSSPGEELDYVCSHYSLCGHSIQMARSISPFSDLIALIRLYWFLQTKHFDIIHSSTPKAGLLAAIAARFASIPIRMHTYTGQPWVEMRGIPRHITRTCDKIISVLETHCYADSASQREFLINERVVHPGKISVPAEGSISGVDLARFNAERWRADRVSTRAELNIPINAMVILFVGRVTQDKGISELIDAFQALSLPDKDVHLVLVGPYEPDRDPLPISKSQLIEKHVRIHHVGFTRQPEKYMGIGDVFCLPSYREGFGSVVIEAAAMGVPAVVTRIVGLTDAVVDGETGIWVSVKDANSLTDGLRIILSNDKLRESMGDKARKRAREKFDANIVNTAVVQEYWNHYYHLKKKELRG